MLISRNEEELKKRVVYLVQSLDKEEQEQDQKDFKAEKAADDKYAILNQAQRDEEMMRLLKEAEEQAAIAFTGLSLQRGEEAEQAEAALNSQNTLDEKENSLMEESPKKNNEVSQNSMDKEMAEAEMLRDYDKAESEKPKPGAKKTKKKAAKKAKREEEEVYSADSGIRLGQG